MFKRLRIAFLFLFSRRYLIVRMGRSRVVVESNMSLPELFEAQDVIEELAKREAPGTGPEGRRGL